MTKPSYHLCRNFLTIFLLLCTGVTGSLFAQDGVVRGQVRGGENEPLSGASVIIKGTQKGVITDEKGQFALTSANSTDTLLFRYIGYLDEEILVGDRTKINLNMRVDVSTLDPVIVIGYGEQREIEKTGATVSIESAEITKLSTANFQESFQGLAGVNVASGDGNPGSAPTITIRGISSALDIGGANEPLYVVDGIPYQGTPNISPNEIERVDILKDAASAAVYGTRGANGVILITTKTAKAGEMKVNFDAYYGIQTLSDGIPLMNTTDFLFYERSWLLNMTSQDAVVYLDDFNNRNFDVGVNTDWIDVFKNPSPSMQNYNLGLSGGNKQLSYNVNINRFDQEGMFINSRFNRTSVRATTKVEKGRLKVRTTVNLQNRGRDELTRNLFRTAIQMTPARGVPDFEAEEFEAALGGRSNDNQLVQLIRIVKDRTEFADNELFGATRISYEIIDGLTVAANVGGRYAAQTREVFRPSFTLVDPEGLVVSQNNASNLIARYDQRVIQRTRFTGDFSFNYKKRIRKGHNLELLGLYSRERFTRSTVDARASGFTSNEALVISNSLNPPVILGDKDFQTIASLLGRVQYNYQQKYLFSASIRRDGASVFPEANRYGLFPSVSFGYNIAKEKFFRNLIPQRVINTFKIRYGYGQTGNSRINSFVFIPTITSNVDYILGDDALTPGTTISDIFNENDLRWETSIQNNLGIDLKMFRSKVNLTVEFYNKRSQDLLFPLNIPGSAGTGFRGNSTVIKNIGDIENRGIEIAAGYRDRIGEEFTFNIRGTFTRNVNTVLRMGTPNQVIFGGAFTGNADDVTAIKEGFPVGSFFVIPSNGVIKTQDDLEAARAYQSAARYGDLKYQDTNGDGVLDDNDRVYAGNPNPTFEAGLTLRAGFRGFDLSVNMYGVYGNTIFNGAAYHAYERQRAKSLINMWSFENPDSEIPVPTRANNSRAWSDYWLEDGSYLRIRNINFGYTFPKFLNVNNTRLYLNFINPFTITNYTGFDPEVGGPLLFQGVDRTNYPLTRRFLLGLQIGF